MSIIALQDKSVCCGDRAVKPKESFSSPPQQTATKPVQSLCASHLLGRPSQRAHRSGFTLLEVLIAIALLAAIAALLISNLDKILGGGNREIARIFVNETMQTPLMTYRVHMGNYPTTEQGLNALLRRPSEDATNWQGPYIKRLANDPWGNPYQYRFPGTRNPGSYDIWSFGPDGTDSAENIGNWEPGTGDDERINESL